jgi:hypothetical protein
LGTNAPNIDEKQLAEMLFIIETEFNKQPYSRLHLSISEDSEDPETAEVSLSAVIDAPEPMEIGDLVKSKNLTVEVLACGSGRYDKAIIYSLEPFCLISEEGDMVWKKMDRNHFEVVGKVDFATMRNAMLRSGLCKPISSIFTLGHIFLLNALRAKE